jgi:hypothetical protein
MLKNAVLSYLQKNYYNPTLGFGDLGSMSCEMLAEELARYFDLSYCSVLEDNENGAEVIC